MTNEQLCEHYGFKAHQYGFFREWREETGVVMKQDPTLDRAEVYRKTFYKLMSPQQVGV
jgi:hypothetical protein